MATISSSNTGFALDLYRTLSRANPTGNIFISPLSISSALAMVYLGAKGDTAAQMAKVRTPSLCYMHLLHHLTSRRNVQGLVINRNIHYEMHTVMLKFRLLAQVCI